MLMSVLEQQNQIDYQKSEKDSSSHRAGVAYLPRLQGI